MFNRFWSVLSVLAVLACVPEAASARPAPADSGATPAPRGWRVEPVLDAHVAWDGNPFLLTAAKKANLGAVSAAEAVSGRYADMESPTDVIPAFDLGLLVIGSGLEGRRLAIRPELRYERYLSNARRSNVNLGLGVEQALPRDGRIRVRSRFTPRYYAKNYLADAIDLDGNKTISASERRYKAGVYAESESWLDGRVRLARQRKSQPIGAALELGIGYYARSYDAPFAGHDLSGPLGSVLLEVGIGPHAVLELKEEVGAIGAEATSEVLLLDEADFGRDFNGNGNTTDRNVRTIQSVDRSRVENSGSATLHLEPSPRADFEMFVGVRGRSYGSDAPLDVGYRDRRDRRVALGAQVRMRLARGVALTLGGESRRQTTNRAGDPGSTGEEDDYRQSVLFAALGYRRHAQ